MLFDASSALVAVLCSSKEEVGGNLIEVQAMFVSYATEPNGADGFTRLSQ
jgi:hypothetical protein